MNAGRARIFDSTPLSAFAVVGRLDLLAALFRGRAQWTIEVYDEIARGIADLPALADVLSADWLPDPARSLAVTEIENTRMALGGKPRDRRHLGEAASIDVATANGWVVAVDDRDATRIAQRRGLGTTTTPAILRECVHAALLDARAAQDLLYEMIDEHGRRLPRLGIGDLS